MRDVTRLLRFLLALAALTAATALVACGGGGDEPPTDDTAQPTDAVSPSDAGGDTGVEPPHDVQGPDGEEPQDVVETPDTADVTTPDTEDDVLPPADTAADTPGPDVVVEPGLLVISELMIDPCLAADEDGEWFEVVNVGDEMVDINGWVIRDQDGAEVHEITHPGSIPIFPGGRLLLGSTTDMGRNGGVDIGYAYGADIRLANSADDIVLERPDGTVSDRVAWGEEGAPMTASCASLQLDERYLDADANDDPAAWCAATTSFGWGDLGTPGVDNTECVSVPCGNGIEDVGEECDDGEANSDSVPDACRTDCTLPGCGDGVIDSGESCDDGIYNSDDAPNACRTDCTEFRCGDGTRDLDEACDDGNDTPDDGCEPDCTLSWECGDGVQDEGEECDDGELNSDTEPDACRSDCLVAFCGDGVADSGEECDEGYLNDDVQPDACRTDCRGPRCGDGVIDFGEECDDGGTQAGDGCDPFCAEEDGGPPRPWVEGQILVTEIMKNPDLVADDDGEWIEVYNRTPVVLDLDGCVLSDDGLERHVIDNGGDLVIEAGAHLVLGRNADPVLNGGVAVDYAYEDFFLANGDDTVVLTCNGFEIDRVVYDDDEFPDAGGRSLSLDQQHYGVSDNDDGANWCAASLEDAYGGANHGTPGAVNPPCPPPAVCGDGDLADGEQCDDGEALNSDTEPNACRTNCTLPRCGDGVTDDVYDEQCDDGDVEDGDGCSAECEIEVGEAPSTAGDLVITEILRDPVGVAQQDGEWIELYNPGDEPLDIDGCRLAAGDGGHLIDAGGPVLILPGGRLVLAAAADPLVNDGILADYAYAGPDMPLGDVTGDVSLTCAGVLIDEVVWDDTFTHEAGRALSLSPARRDAAQNDDATAWCLAEDIYGTYNAGTPGAANADCPAPATCGDGEQEAGEQCDDGDLNSDTTADACRTDCTLPRCGDGVADEGEECDDGNESIGDGCTPQCISEGAQAPSAAGQLAFTEVMPDPTPLPAVAGEWFELRNLSGVLLDMGGCTVSDGTGPGWSFPADHEVTPGAIVLLAAGADPAGDGSVTPTLVYPSDAIPLGDDAGVLVLTCGGVEIDRIRWAAAEGWPVEAGHSLTLDGEITSHLANDLLDAWCPATTPMGAGQVFGTPGAPNDRCPGTCNNGVQEWDEECDDGILNSDTLPDRCRTDCTLPYCGDGVRDGDEACDDGGNEPGDGCAADCTTESATECGNGDLEVGEECDDGELNSDTVSNACRTDCRLPYCGDEVVDDGEDCDDGNAIPDDGCSPLCSWDYLEQTPDEHGQAFVTELLVAPTAGAEWFELLNNYGWPLDLQGCRISAADGSGFDIDARLVVEPAAYLVFSGGDADIAADWTWDPAAFALADDGGQLTLVCGEVLIDRLTWDSGTGFPLAAGQATALDPMAYTATSNDAASNWCLATDGTPGAFNMSCELAAICGNGIQEDGEECDDGAFNSVSEPNACRGDCRNAYCGDDVVDAGEGCDDGDNEDGDGCAADCTVEAICGNGNQEEGEDCDDGDDNSDSAPDACRMDCTLPFCGDGVIDSDEQCDDGGNDPRDGCSPLCEYESTPEPVYLPGQVIFAEIMTAPQGIDADAGEWFELRNPTTGVWDLDGCRIEGALGDAIDITGQLYVGPGEQRLFATSPDPAADGSVDVDVVYAFVDLALGNDSGSLTLACGDLIVDSVAWSSDEWPLVSGASLALDPTAGSAALNDAPRAWCEGAVPYGDGSNLGTPGGDNPSCGYASICGNGLLEDDEDCDDGDDNSDAFPDACREDCRAARCGDGVIDDGEECDDGDLEGGDGCSPLCLQEGTCGNGVQELGEECDDGPLNSDTIPDRCRESCRLPGCGDGVIDIDEACDDGDLDDDDGCSSLCEEEDLPAPAQAGAVVITELMVDPAGTPDDQGEWFEVTNPTDQGIDLAGCVFESDGEAGLTVFGRTPLGPGERMVFAISSDPAGDGAPWVNYVYSPLELSFAEDVDFLHLVCGTTSVDIVTWVAAVGWPIYEGRSLALDPAAEDPWANDDAANWCPGLTPYGPNLQDTGTPGLPNPACQQ